MVNGERGKGNGERSCEGVSEGRELSEEWLLGLRYIMFFLTQRHHASHSSLLPPPYYLPFNCSTKKFEMRVKRWWRVPPPLIKWLRLV